MVVVMILHFLDLAEDVSRKDRSNLIDSFVFLSAIFDLFDLFNGPRRREPQTPRGRDIKHSLK